MHRRWLAEQIAAATEKEFVPIASSQPCGGGCINHAEKITLQDGRTYFVKSNENAADMFAQEANGLLALGAQNCLRIPKVVGQFREEKTDYLVMEFLASQSPTADFFPVFGMRLSELHQTASSDWFGWHSDNYLGSSLQHNNRCRDWPEFFSRYRLQPQIKLASDQALANQELKRGIEQICIKLDRLLGESPKTSCLLHGDLWSGNFMSDEDGQPAIFDPAVYYGHREAELAMPLLFGGFPQSFYEAYNETWPLETGWQDRVEIYKLYHLLNHLNLFGSGYMESCLRVVRRFA